MHAISSMTQSIADHFTTGNRNIIASADKSGINSLKERLDIMLYYLYFF